MCHLRYLDAYAGNTSKDDNAKERELFSEHCNALDIHEFMECNFPSQDTAGIFESQMWFCYVSILYCLLKGIY